MLVALEQLPPVGNALWRGARVPRALAPSRPYSGVAALGGRTNLGHRCARRARGRPLEAAGTDCRPAHLQPDADREGSTVLGERFHWDNRTTGVTPDWQAYYGRWTHYDPQTLQVERSGRIRKALKANDDDTFILHNCFEVPGDPLTQDGMASGFRSYLTARGSDGHHDFKYPFKYTPGRATPLPGESYIWTGAPLHLPEAVKADPHAAVSKAMLVRPKAATWAGPPYIPPAALSLEAQAAGEAYQAFCSTEMWLSDSEEERLKQGVLLGYNTVSGELAVLFRCHERHPDGSPSVEDVDAAFDYDEVAPEIVNSSAGTGHPAAASMPPRPFEGFIEEHPHATGAASVLLLERDASVPCSVEGAGYRETWWGSLPLERGQVWSPTEGDDRYLHLQFDDGAYLNIPRSLADFYEDEFVYEFGACLYGADGKTPVGVHRLISVADRNTRGGHYMFAYERFSVQSDDTAQ